MPFPNPVMRRAGMSCPSEKEDAWIVAPITIMQEPIKIVRLRPRMFPTKIVKSAPKKHPRV